MVAKSTLVAASYEAPRTAAVSVSMIEEASIVGSGRRARGSGARPRDFLLKLDDAVNERFRARRTPGHVHVDRNHLVDALDDRVIVEHAADRRACAHRDDPLRIRHLVIDAAHRRRHLSRETAGDDHQVRLPGRAAEYFGAKP